MWAGIGGGCVALTVAWLGVPGAAWLIIPCGFAIVAGLSLQHPRAGGE